MNTQLRLVIEYVLVGIHGRIELRREYAFHESWDRHRLEMLLDRTMLVEITSDFVFCGQVFDDRTV